MAFFIGKREKAESPRKKTGPSGKHAAKDKEECCPDNPCLILLRRAAIAERKAILFYLGSAVECCELHDLFLAIAEDEMRHFIMIMRLIARFDPVQAAAFEAAGLDFLTMGRAMPPKWAKEYQPEYGEIPPAQRQMCCLALLSHAISDELSAINDYQAFMEETASEACRDLFCELMNDEKEHVACLTAAMLEMSDEPRLD
ncbi:MAG TPA: ferritin-like domain-containing protein [Selenomonadales bacterium]|nr:ferritin-like domain-containing protein [Selenomonadales bacterium]